MRTNMMANKAGITTTATMRRPARVIAISGGKGGVGKTNVSVNLAISLANEGSKVMLLDADTGLASVNVLLGLNPEHDLSHVLQGVCSLDDVVIEGPSKLKIIPGAAGINQLANLSAIEQAGLIHAFSDITHAIDVLVVDTGAGISDTVLNFCSASHEIIVVVCNEPASIAAAVAFISAMNRRHRIDRFRIIANMVYTAAEGNALFDILTGTTDQVLDVMLTYMGAIPFDRQMRSAIQARRAVVDAFPDASASVALKRLAKQIDSWPCKTSHGGELEFFLERLYADAGGSGGFQ